MSIWHYDFESTSACDIRLGSYRYGCDPTTRILIAAIADETGEPVAWRIDEPEGEESKKAVALMDKAIEAKDLIYAHNAQFELAMTEYRLREDLGHKAIPSLDQWRCTAAMCRRAAIPESLGKAADFLKLPVQKDGRGKSLIAIFSDQTKEVTLTPPKGMKDPETTKNGAIGRKPKNVRSKSPILDPVILWDWEVKVDGTLMTVRAAWELFIEYCKQDVRTERELHKKLARFELKGDELASFQWDMRMNHRGVPVNVSALKHAQKLVEEYQERHEARILTMCGCGSGQRARLLAWLRERGYTEDNLQAETVERVLKNPKGLREKVVKVLKYRSLLSFAAIKKIPTMIAAACPDGRVRGTTLWHGARTGRATGRIIQPQNMKKATISDSALAYAMICDHEPLSEFEALWESPLEVIASCCRHFMQRPEGMMLDADYEAVEARITPWLAGDEAKLQSLLDGVDPYKAIASQIFKVPYEEVNKLQRTIAKPVELGCCIAEGQEVLTPRGNVRIEDISLDDLVWDGVEWVSHEGLIYQGIREVITYQGLTATPDHEVYTEELSGKIPFRQAIREKLRLRDGGARGSSFRAVPTAFKEDPAGERTSESQGSMSMRDDTVELSGRPKEGVCHPMSLMQVNRVKETLSAVVGSKVLCCEAQMPESQKSPVQRLWAAWNRVQIRFGVRGIPMDDGELRSPEGEGGGPHKQLRTLRTGESEVVHQVGAVVEQSKDEVAQGVRISTERVTLLQGHHGAKTSGRMESDPDSECGQTCDRPKNQELANHSIKVRVYDLLNAGPRHRFTVSGKLVSNCFGVGGKGLQQALANPPYNIQRTLKECKDYVSVYRKNHSATVDAWAEIEAAAKHAIRTGEVRTACDGKLAFAKIQTAGIPYLVMRLPSGRRLYYPNPEIKAVKKLYDEEEMKEEPWKREKGHYWIDSISFYGKTEQVWCHIHTWGSRLFENAVQATGVDLLNYGCLQAEKEGYEIIMIVHDQALAEDKGKPLDGYAEALCRKQPWAETFPLAAKTDLVPFYLKD